MKKAKKPKTMKMLIKKIAVVACVVTLAFSMIPATVQAAGNFMVKGRSLSSFPHPDRGRSS